MKTAKIIFLILLTFFFFSCKKKEVQKKNFYDFESEVFSEVFTEIVDSTYQDGRLYFKFPDLISIEARKVLLEKDTTRIVLAIDIEKYKLDLKKYNNRKFEFKSISEFPRNTNDEIWETKYDFEFAGALYFYPIKFNSTKEKGTLKVLYGCGTKCGANYEVSIEKENGKWKLEKVEQTGSI
ncbi:hypothetical protein AB3G33_16185 [Flavobacterium sp. WC2421]|uniref:Lipoprotein n=2 Tax=unclassified Flavobacterium TaxID=196869 RepID=A0AB39W0M4_9FLAO